VAVSGERPQSIRRSAAARHVSSRDRLGAAALSRGAGDKADQAWHGIKANRNTFEVAAAFSNQQGLTPRVVKIDEIFAPSAMSS
jgi:hypothetical protein